MRNTNNGCNSCYAIVKPVEKPKQENIPPVIKPEPKPKPITIETVACGKAILSITQVGDKALVMYEDCTYSTAPMSVVNLNCLGSTDTLEVKSISEVDGKVLIAYNNGKYITASKDVVDTNLNGNLEAKAEIKSVKDKINEFIANIVPVQNTNDEVINKAFNSDYTPTKL